MGSLLSPALSAEAVVLGMFQAALQAKSCCIDSLQAVVSRQREELALAWASIEKERQARSVAEDGVKALQGALDTCRGELREAMQTRRGDHNKLLHQLSCEWQVLEVLEEEQRKREAAEAALALTHAWMERCLLRCDQLQRQHHLQRQQIKAAQEDRDSRWQAWVRQAVHEHEQVRQLCHHADIAMPDFHALLPQHPPVPGAEETTAAAGPPPQSKQHSGECVGEGPITAEAEHTMREETLALPKSSSCSELRACGVALPLKDALQERSYGDHLGPPSAGVGAAVHMCKGLYSPGVLFQANPKGAMRAAAAPASSSRMAARQGALRSPNKTPRGSPNKVPLEEFGGLVTRIVQGAVPMLEARRSRAEAVRRSPLAGSASKSAPTSPLRKTFVTRIGPSQGLKDLPCNPAVHNESRHGRMNLFRDGCQSQACVGQDHALGSTSAR